MRVFYVLPLTELSRARIYIYTENPPCNFTLIGIYRQRIVSSRAFVEISIDSLRKKEILLSKEGISSAGWLIGRIMGRFEPCFGET